MKNQAKLSIVAATLWWAVVLILSVIIILAAIIFRQHLSQFKSLGLFGIFLANLLGSAIPFIPVPGILTVITGGILYAPFPVALLATLGGVMGDTLSFLVGLSGKKLLVKKEHKLHQHLVAYMKKYGAVAIFLFALIPNPIFDTIGILAGVLDYSFTKFVLWLFLGRLARNLILAFLGSKIDLFY